MNRILDVHQSPMVIAGPDRDELLAPSLRSLADEVVAILEHTGEGGDITQCGCGTRVGHVLDDSDDLHPVTYWGPYTIWADQHGQHVVLCEDCSHGAATSQELAGAR